MSTDELEVVSLQDNFYRDSINRLYLVILGVFICIAAFIGLSVYLYLQKPLPVTFYVYDEFRVQDDVPVIQPYLSDSDLLQWVSNVIPKAFNLDFVNYNNQLKALQRYFTGNGWKIFLNQLNIYANYNNVQTNKLFVSGVAAGAPYIINSNVLSGRFAWWVKMPVNINFAGYNPLPNRTLTLQVLVVRVPTLNNLDGVGIENIIVANNVINNALGP